ncbi:hypothetical protein E4Z66_15415 [Aliishimia ponticola]|uniref:Uncharacterized protein n=1 Tax=Aliishimia ponticola TaxID=2499833 RepID=A0A4S4NB62_9RHOB|nr:hypothetical protein [Aliishimia ponticola]THH35211.1 hypothetical protein E4Z66_15415 [Aliishimia ponticola]
MFDPNLSIEDRIKDIIRREIDEYETDTEQTLATLDAFRAAFQQPQRVTVHFAGGTTRDCWSVTRSDGTYRVVYLPVAGYFALCVESNFGPKDIGVHGSAIGCFSSV